jgi:hypothetical protein
VAASRRCRRPSPSPSSYCQLFSGNIAWCGRQTKVKHKVPTYNSFGNANLSKKVSVVTAEMTDVRSQTHHQRDMMRSKTDKSKMCIPKRTLSFFLFCTTNQAAR